MYYINKCEHGHLGRQLKVHVNKQAAHLNAYSYVTQPRLQLMGFIMDQSSSSPSDVLLKGQTKYAMERLR